MVLETILAASFAVSLISLIGVFTLGMREKLLHSLLFYFVSFAAGAMLAAAFLDLLPEGIALAGVENFARYALFGLLVFFMIEKFIHWHHHHKHHHKGEHTEAPFTYLNLIGDAVHNFIDGTVITASFLTSTELGIVSTIAIIAHEIPQELGDYSLLIYGGFSKQKALFYNFLTALTSILGALTAFYFSSLVPNLSTLLIPFAAGGFIYIASADLVPELHKERDVSKSILQFMCFAAGIVLIAAVIGSV